MKKVLLYGIEEDALSLYRNILLEKEIQTVVLSDDDLQTKIVELFKRDKDSKQSKTSIVETFMIFDGITNEELVSLVHLFQDRGKAFDGIKIMRTETNEKWILKDLMEETSREHVLFQKIKALDNVLKSCNQLDFTNMNQDEEKNIKMAMMDAYMYLQAGHFDLKTVEQKSMALMEALRNTQLGMN